MINVKINNKTIEVSEGTLLKEIAKDYQNDFENEIILAKVNGIYKELSDKVKKDCEVEFFDLKDKGSNSVYLNGLIFMTIYAYKKLFGFKENIIVRHSLDKGLYIETTNNITKDNILELSNIMKEVVNNKLPIERVTVSRLEAMEYFKAINDNTKSEIMKYITSTHLTLYKLGNVYDYFYSLMPINTSVLSQFELTYFNENGFILRFPTIYMKDGIKDFEPRHNIYNLYTESRSWAKRLDLENVVDLNKKVEYGKVNEIIQMDELWKNTELMELSKKILSNDKVRVILLAGPSSTGKTTTTNKLTLCLKSLGKKVLMLSMDDYFVERDETPKDENGDYDFERIEAVDLNLFEDCVKKLINKEEVALPTFNFVLGKKEYNKKTKIDDDTILLVEGIHALNPKVLAGIPKEEKTTIYLSALNELNVDNHTRISTTDNRLLRRIVRDNRTRGLNVEATLASWPKVRFGEENYIFPYQDEADYAFNTAMIYELGVLKTFVEPLLYSVTPDSPYYNEAVRLINFLRLFLPIPTEDIPKDSIIREFIGGGCFKI